MRLGYTEMSRMRAYYDIIMIQFCSYHFKAKVQLVTCVVDVSVHNFSNHIFKLHFRYIIWMQYTP